MNNHSIPMRRYQARLLVLLALINFVNFADRTVILPLFPLLRQEFGLSGTQLGWTQTVLQIVLSLATIPFALWADRASRVRIIAGGVIFWSVATFLTGLAGSFATLLMGRALIGIGEAAYGPAAQSIISGAFSKEARARAQSVFAAEMLFGGASGQVLGGLIGHDFGWRPAFYFVGVPGIILGLLIWKVDDPPRGPRQELVPIGHLLRVPAFLAMIFSGMLITFGGLSFLTWGPDFVVTQKGFSVREAGLALGSTALFSLVAGVITGGAMADWLHKRFNYGRVLTVCMGFLLGAPFTAFAVYAQEKQVVLTMFFAATFFVSWYHGPVTALIHDMMPRRAHATSVGVYNLATQLVGGVLGPLVTGSMADTFGLQAGLKVAIGVLVLGGLSFLLVIYFVRRDGLRHPAVEPFRLPAED
jgi:MFS transporter, Spinster family, sphingosine-1-phosphate transporter